MADDVVLNAGAGGQTCASDDIGGIQFQRIKLVFGPDGVNRGDVEQANPFPVVIATVSPSFVFASQSGTFTVFLATTSANQGAGGSSAWPVALATTSITGAVYVASVTAVQGAGGSSAWPVALATTSISGNVGVSGNVGATQSGVWTVGINTGSQVAIASVNGNIGISGNVGATQSGVWNVGVNSGAQIAIASGSLSTGTFVIGGTYDVSRRFMDEFGRIQAASDSFANASSSGNTAVVAAQGTGVRIRVFSAYVQTAGAQTIGFQSDTTAISASFPIYDRTGFVLPYNPHGWFQTIANQALNINLGAATTTGVQVSWGTTT